MPLDTSASGAIVASARRVQERIAESASRVGRDQTTIRLVAVTKTFPVTHVLAAAAAGLTDLGENRVQEALNKRDAISATGDLKITWHLIGHLQSNKARKAVGAFPWIHSVDSKNMLLRLDQAAAETGVRPDLLVQVDLAGEATKFGAPVEEVRRILEAGSRCTAVTLRGLMVIPPWSEDAETARPFFRRLRELRDQFIEDGLDGATLGELSMGMSHDFEVAIEEGSTIVRIGTAIFGRRAR